MLNQDTGEYYRQNAYQFLSEFVSKKVESQEDDKLGLIFAIFLLILLFFLFFARPISANPIEENIKTKDTGQIVQTKTNEDFKKEILEKYGSKNVYFPAKGIAHIKTIKYINSKPIKINIVEINTNVNPNLKVKPQTANKKLNSKSTVRKIAQKENALVAINAGYFKPQTGVPLGALVIDGEILTGPIFNRVGIGIFEEEGNITYAMDNIAYDIMAFTKSSTLKIDNINQPRMSQSLTLMYTSVWGKISPPPPKNGYNILIKDNKITKMSANPIEMEENDIVISSSKEKITEFAKEKDVKINLNVLGKMKNAKHIIGAGPYLIKNSQIFVDVKTQKLTAISGKNPRSAIGYTKDNNLIILTIDGREKASVGMTLGELAQYMKKLGCVSAMNFDGGSSSALYVNGRIVNDAVNKEGIAISNALTISEAIEDRLQISSL